MRGLALPHSTPQFLFRLRTSTPHVKEASRIENVSPSFLCHPLSYLFVLPTYRIFHTHKSVCASLCTDSLRKRHRRFSYDVCSHLISMCVFGNSYKCSSQTSGIVDTVKTKNNLGCYNSGRTRIRGLLRSATATTCPTPVQRTE